MKAVVGDVLHVQALHVDGPVRSGEVIEVRGADGEPPFVVRWSDGHEALVFPGSDVTIQHKP